MLSNSFNHRFASASLAVSVAVSSSIVGCFGVPSFRLHAAVTVVADDGSFAGEAAVCNHFIFFETFFQSQPPCHWNRCLLLPACRLSRPPAPNRVDSRRFRLLCSLRPFRRPDWSMSLQHPLDFPFPSSLWPSLLWWQLWPRWKHRANLEEGKIFLNKNNSNSSLTVIGEQAHFLVDAHLFLGQLPPHFHVPLTPMILLAWPISSRHQPSSSPFICTLITAGFGNNGRNLNKGRPQLE